MGVKPGYKQTEVGVIPEDWDIIKLNNIVSNFVNGGTPSTKNKDYWNGNIPWITGADIINQCVGEIRRHITKDAVRNSSTNVIQKGNLLIVSRTGVGKLAITPFDIAISQDFTGIYMDASQASTEYIYRFFDYHQSLLKKEIQGTSIKGITRDTLAEIQIPVPTLAEQTAIATALSDADALIQSLERFIAKKRDIKQGAMQELLTGKKRLPGFEKKKGYKQTEVGVIPEDWDVIQLKDVADKITVGFVGSMAYLFQSGGVPLLRGQNVLPHRLDLSDIKYISIDTHRLWKKSSLRPRDVVMVRVGYPGTSCVIPNNLGDANAASLVVVRPTTQKLNSDFFCYVVNSGFGRRQIDGYLVGGAQQVLNTTTAAIFLLPLPTRSEQSAIATIISDMDAEIAALDSKLAKAHQIKQGMMQELLTGRIRLS